jgi:hypothetical protein
MPQTTQQAPTATRTARHRSPLTHRQVVTGILDDLVGHGLWSTADNLVHVLSTMNRLPGNNAETDARIKKQVIRACEKLERDRCLISSHRLLRGESEALPCWKISEH